MNSTFSLIAANLVGSEVWKFHTGMSKLYLWTYA